MTFSLLDLWVNVMLLLKLLTSSKNVPGLPLPGLSLSSSDKENVIDISKLQQRLHCLGL